MHAPIVPRDARSPRRGRCPLRGLMKAPRHARLDRGAQVLIADMTATISRDHAGADAGHTASAGMRQVKGGHASSARALTNDAPENRPSIRPVDLDVTDQQTIGAGVQALLTAEGQL